MKLCKACAGRISKFFHRYVNGTKGVISILLALLMTPFITIAGVLINAARINSAIAVFDEALCNASNSTLGTYDDFLRSRFGLLAMSQTGTTVNGTTYTPEELISETFQFYMQENLKVLSNTYTDAEVDAAGVYPLADTDVLTSQVLEYSKYSVPTKLIIDGLDLNDLIGELTSKLSSVTNILNTITDGINVGTALADAQTKMDALIDAITAANTARDNYENAYENFRTVVTQHNDLIDERNREVKKCEDAVATAQTNLTNAESRFGTAKTNYQWIIDEINRLANEKDSEGNPVDNSKKIAKLESDYEAELKEYREAEQGVKDCQAALNTAQTNLTNTINTYAQRISTKRTEVTQKRDTYAQKIGELAAAINTVKTATTQAQTAIQELSAAGTKFTKGVVTAVTTEANKSVDEDIEEMKKNQSAAKDRGDNTAAYLWGDKIDEAKQDKNDNSNTSTILNASLQTQSDAEKALVDFSNTSLEAAYDVIYNALIKLQGQVKAISIPTGLDKMGDVTSYKYTYESVMTLESVKKLLSDLADELDPTKEGSPFMDTVKAVAGFIKAIFKMPLIFDPTMNGTLDKGKYSVVGGLPSSLSQSSLKSGYADVDSAKSNYYKELLGAYSADGMSSGSVDTIESTIDSIIDNLDTLTKNRKWSLGNVFTNLSEMFNAIVSIVSSLITLATKIIQVIATAVFQKALLAGYIAYNVPSRNNTDMLTGTSASLDASGTGYGFKGAELEYILIGGTSEIANQTSVFTIIYGLRILMDIPCVIPNQEVASIASAAGSATFGVGTVIVYVLYFLAEPLVDTMIICNGESVPMFKTKLYLTPSGVVDLIGKFLKLKLSDDQKNTAYAEVVKVMSLGQTDDDFPQNYADAVSSGISDPSLGTDGGLKAKAMETLEFDYTKTLLLLMMFWNSDTLTKRLADVIQMEATVKYGGANSTFRLSKSYTYLRASGRFTSTEFIRISDSEGLNSTERVVYRGY